VGVEFSRNKSFSILLLGRAIKRKIDIKLEQNEIIKVEFRVQFIIKNGGGGASRALDLLSRRAGLGDGGAISDMVRARTERGVALSCAGS
jgi:hypothetical protein